MSKLSRDLRASAKRGTHIPATVVEALFNRASARLSNNGAIVRNLAVIGGPVEKGDTVLVDYTTPEPTIVAIGKEWVSFDDLNNALSRLDTPRGSGTITLAVDLFVGGSLYRVYSPDVQGLGQALTDAADGDSVHYHNACLTTDVTVPEGVSLIGLDPVNCVIKGKITLGSGSYLQNIGAHHTASSGSDTIGVEMSGSGQSIVEDCHIFTINCDIGTCYAVSCVSPISSMIVRDCIIYAESSGSGFAVRGGGDIQVEHSRLYGNTASYSGDVEVYSNYEKVTDTGYECPGQDYVLSSYDRQVQDGVAKIDLDNLVNQGVEVIDLGQNDNATMFGPLRADNYVYYSRYTTGGGWQVGEIDLNNTGSPILSSEITDDRVRMRSMCIDTQRNVYIITQDSDSPYTYYIKKISFPAGTISTVWSREGYDEPSPNVYKYWDTGPIDWMVSTMINGVHRLAFGVQIYISDSGESTTEYLSATHIIEPSSQSPLILYQETQLIPPVVALHSAFGYMFAPIYMKNSNKVVYFYSVDITENQGGLGLPMHVIDMVAGNMSEYLLDPLDSDYYVSVFMGVGDYQNNVVYAELVGWNGDRRSWCSIDMTGTVGIIHNGGTSFGGTFYPIASYRTGQIRYYYNVNNTIYNKNGVELFDASSTSLDRIWPFGTYPYLQEFSQMTGTVLDDVHSYFYYYCYLGGLSGYNGIAVIDSTTGAFVRYIALPDPWVAITPSDTVIGLTLHVLGGVIVITVKRWTGSAWKTKYFLVKESAA